MAAHMAGEVRLRAFGSSGNHSALWDGMCGASERVRARLLEALMGVEMGVVGPGRAQDGLRTCCCLREAVGRPKVLRALPHLDGRREGPDAPRGPGGDVTPEQGASSPSSCFHVAFTPLLF